MYASIQFVLNHPRYSITNNQMSHVQYVIKNDGKVSDGKLLCNDKMPLMANQPPPTFTVMKKSLRSLCKSDDFHHLACDCISHILLLHDKFIFFVEFHFSPILISVYIFWLIFLLFTDFFGA